MNNDGICLIALNHANVEEAGVFPIHGVMHEAAIAISMVLRRLHHSNLGVDEGRHEVFEPVGTYHVIGIDHGNKLGVSSGMRERETQSTGFEAADIVVMQELETPAER